MAFAFEIQDQTVFGNKRIVFGTYTNGGGDTGGDIETGLTVCESIQLTQTGSAVTTGAPVVNETLPVSGGDVTIVTDDGADGTFFAIGY